MMNRIMLAACAGLVAATATPASAADYFVSVGPGTTSTDFGASATGSGVLDDRYFFTVPVGIANGLVGSIALEQDLDVDLNDVRLDTTPFNQIVSDGTELWTLSATNIAAGTHFIRIIGTWGQNGGSYAGTLNFSPTAVPEPASWMMLILGTGLIGFSLRAAKTRQRVTYA